MDFTLPLLFKNFFFVLDNFYMYEINYGHISSLFSSPLTLPMYSLIYAPLNFLSISGKIILDKERHFSL